MFEWWHNFWYDQETFGITLVFVFLFISLAGAIWIHAYFSAQFSLARFIDPPKPPPALQSKKCPCKVEVK
jgi:Na+-transporting methylmalonyl-CoA/oxaloacetate decarboxylase gamma subunit